MYVCLSFINYSKRFGVTKNRKVIIEDIKINRIGVTIANMWIPRTQFPFRLAYCLTYNKIQGQSSKGVIMDVTYPPFPHGHLYVALTRCRFYGLV